MTQAPGPLTVPQAGPPVRATHGASTWNQSALSKRGRGDPDGHVFDDGERVTECRIVSDTPEDELESVIDREFELRRKL